MRQSGILMPLFSLPSPYGIGSMGKEAFGFIDFLKKSGQSIWQMLPVCPTSYGDSPYQSFSSYAGNPYFIDLDLLAKDGYLEKADYESVFFGDDDCKIDYGALYNNRYPVLYKAYKNFIQ
jgi:4-alpha-glucanotransferase